MPLIKIATMSNEEFDSDFKKWADEQGMSVSDGSLKFENIEKSVPISNAEMDNTNSLLKALLRENEYQTKILGVIKRIAIFWFWLTILGLFLWLILLLID